MSERKLRPTDPPYLRVHNGEKLPLSKIKEGNYGLIPLVEEQIEAGILEKSDTSDPIISLRQQQAGDIV